MRNNKTESRDTCSTYTPKRSKK